MKVKREYSFWYTTRGILHENEIGEGNGFSDFDISELMDHSPINPNFDLNKIPS
jgi:hypothetical protein